MPGAAFIASVDMGNNRFEDIPQLIEINGIFSLNNDNKAIYDELYQTFLDIYRKNKGIFDRLNGIRR
jgi:xylulokinase